MRGLTQPLELGIACCCFTPAQYFCCHERGGPGAAGTTWVMRASCDHRSLASAAASLPPTSPSTLLPALLPKTLLWKVLQLEVLGLGPGTGAARSPWLGSFRLLLLCSPAPAAQRGGRQRALPLHGCWCQTLLLPQSLGAFSAGHIWNGLCFYNHLCAILSFFFSVQPHYCSI